MSFPRREVTWLQGRVEMYPGLILECPAHEVTSMSEVLSKLEAVKIVPVVAIENADHAKPLSEALIAGGLPCAEITFRTAAAKEAIAAASKVEGMLVGAGTVLTVDQVKEAVDAGAEFIVSPGFDPKVAEYCVSNNIPLTPGIATGTEIQMALSAGIDVVKFFPAEAIGGLKLLKALAAPYGNVRFIPTGGINTGNLKDYLAFDKILACGGSWMVKKDMIADEKFDVIKDLTADAMAIANEVRP